MVLWKTGDSSCPFDELFNRQQAPWMHHQGHPGKLGIEYNHYKILSEKKKTIVKADAASHYLFKKKIILHKQVLIPYFLK